MAQPTPETQEQKRTTPDANDGTSHGSVMLDRWLRQSESEEPFRLVMPSQQTQSQHDITNTSQTIDSEKPSNN
ncbi:hypothetical protein N3K66_003522 [Trichothecium roseum]|uniref:Uncharacterized protein n=1 Tax=Trichothecium roseum TaxID=47278 RepID=A0ACC0V5F9_9HYPO|nr:hypothetical protein N3K66_003522 [Trichothecium roseum]